MLGAPCSPCCDQCGPELDALPERFEVDVFVVAADELYLSLRYAQRVQAQTASGGYHFGFLQSWHGAPISSGTRTLAYVSTVNGVALYRYVSAGLILEMTCTPSTSGKYSTFLTAVVVRTTTQVYSRYSGGGNYGGQSVPLGSLLLDVAYDSNGNAVPSANSPQNIPLSKMRADSLAITEEGASVGQLRSLLSEYYSLEQACHALRIGSRLACPSPIVQQTAAVNTEIVTPTQSLVTVHSSNWPMSIRARCRIIVGPVFTSLRFRASEQSPDTPGIHHGFFPGEGTVSEWGEAYATAVGWNDPGFPGNRINLPGTGWSLPELGVIIQEQGLFFQTFRRDLDITQIRAVYADSTKTWPT